MKELICCWICEERIETVDVMITKYGKKTRDYLFHRDCIGDVFAETIPHVYDNNYYICVHCRKMIGSPLEMLVWTKEVGSSGICRECWDKDFGLET